MQRREAEQRRQEWERARLAGQAGAASGSAGARPLRFVLRVGLVPQVGDKSNPSCYSNIITRPGPPGWGSADEGFLPTGVAEQAIQTIESVHADFLAKCRAASGHETLNSISHSRNQTARDGADLGNWRARTADDYTVQVD